MRIRLTYLLMFLILFTFELNAKVNNPEAKKGTLNLRGISDPEHFTVELNGEWEFYWEKMLRPYDFLTGNIKPDYFGKVPSYWTDYPKESIKTAPLGYATYRLTVLLPAGLNSSLGIDLPVFDSSYDIYINGKILSVRKKNFKINWNS